MTNGLDSSRRFPYLLIRFRIRDRTFEVEALLDTGFDGFLLVPEHLLEDFVGGAPTDWQLADGTWVILRTFLGEVTVGPFAPFRASILAAGTEALVGRGISDRFKITLDHGRRLIIEL